MATYRYKMKGTLTRPTHLFRYPPNGACPEYLDGDGLWQRDARLLSYVQDDPLGADDIDRATARRVAALLGMPPAVPADDGR